MNKRETVSTLKRIFGNSINGEWVFCDDLNILPVDNSAFRDLQGRELIEQKGNSVAPSYRLSDEAIAMVQPKSAFTKAYKARRDRAAKYQAVADRLYHEFIYQVSFGNHQDAQIALRKRDVAIWHATRAKTAGFFTYGWETRRSNRKGGYYVAVRP